MAETEQEAGLLAELASSLGEHLTAATPGWVDAVLRNRAPASADPAAVQRASDRVVEIAKNETIPAVLRLLGTDIDEQWSSPLEIVRMLVAPLTEQLTALNATPIDRNAGLVELHPDDRFGLTPATFADLHPDLQQPGLAWGAAKAHIHIKRHGRKGPQAAPTVVVFAPDLADRSRFDAFSVTHVRSAGKLIEFAETTEPDLVIVDLDRTSAPGDFRIENAHVVGFGSHVDTDRHDEALDAGFDAVMARSIFFRRLPELLAPVVKGQDD